MRRFFLPLLALPLVACVADGDVGAAEGSLSVAGPWDIPADTLAVGESMSVEYTGAGAWRGESGCHPGGLTDGGEALRSWMMEAFPQISSIGGYSCRHINGDSSTMSVHATGRALDVFIPLHAGDADNDLGDPVANYLIEHAEEIGIQLIIWDRWSWGPHRRSGAKERSYGGAHPHHDHLHVEISVEASRLETPFFSGGMPVPERECEALGATGGVIDDASDCFSAYGPATYWRSAAGGHGGGYLWTNAYQGDEPSNWARWHASVASAGDYRVEVHLPADHAVHRTARYQVRHGGVDRELTLDLSGASGWVELGTFRFTGDGAEHVSVYDNSPTAVGSNQHIPADAVRWTRADTAPPPPGPTPEPVPGTRVLDMDVAHYAPAGPVASGDPGLDDDPMVPLDDDRRSMTLVGTCSASPAGRAAPGMALVFFALAFVSRRRR